jgi:hypothetical protein
MPARKWPAGRLPPHLKRRLYGIEALREAIFHGAVKRLRPKSMTVATMMLGLVPIMWSAGTGADVMKRIAAPLIGGIVTSFVLELLVYPALYELWKWQFETEYAAGEPPAVAIPGLSSDEVTRDFVLCLSKIRHQTHPLRSAPRLRHRTPP